MPRGCRCVWCWTMCPMCGSPCSRAVGMAMIRARCPENSRGSPPPAKPTRWCCTGLACRRLSGRSPDGMGNPQCGWKRSFCPPSSGNWHSHAPVSKRKPPWSGWRWPGSPSPCAAPSQPGPVVHAVPALWHLGGARSGREPGAVRGTHPPGHRVDGGACGRHAFAAGGRPRRETGSVGDPGPAKRGSATGGLRRTVGRPCERAGEGARQRQGCCPGPAWRLRRAGRGTQARACVVGLHIASRGHTRPPNALNGELPTAGSPCGARGVALASCAPQA